MAKLPFMPPKQGQHAVQQRPHSYLEPQTPQPDAHARAAPAAALRAPAAARVEQARPTSSPAFLRGPRGPQIRAAAAAQMASPCMPPKPSPTLIL